MNKQTAILNSHTRPQREAMGPKAAAAAVEIDPRLLRQLEEEYESLKSTSAGARPPPTRDTPPAIRESRTSDNAF